MPTSMPPSDDDKALYEQYLREKAAYEAAQKNAAASPASPEQDVRTAMTPDAIRERQGAFTRTLLSSLPGAEMAAGAVEVLRGGDYQKGRQAFAAKREEAKAKLGTGARFAATTVGEAAPYFMGGPATMMGRALMAGGIGAVRGASKAGLEEDVAPSAVETLKAAGTQAAKEAVLGEIGNVLGIAGKAAVSPTRSALLTAQKAARTAAAGPAYKAFQEMGTLPMTQALRDVMATPAVQQAIRTVQSESTKLGKLPVTDAKVLDAVYKRIGNKAWARTSNFQELSETRSTLLDAINDAAVQKATAQAGSDPAAIAALLSTPYKTPVTGYAQGSAAMQGTIRGAKAIRTAARGGAASERAIMEYGPEAMTEWARTASPAEREAAIAGAYAQLKESPLLRKFFIPTETFRSAPDVLSRLGARATGPQRAIRGAITSLGSPD